MTNDLHGLLVIDKPGGITSRDAVNRVQKQLPPRTRIGHTGTLDPLATGVLVLCIGNATRLAEFVQDMDKVYRTTAILGARSDTDDADGSVTPTVGAEAIDETVIRSRLAELIGAIEQTPPAFSAVKVGGRRAHELARRGDAVNIQPRQVNVYAIDLLRYDWPQIDLDIHCGKGTYVRSLVRDLGESLGCGAYVKTLRRARVGPFHAEDGIACYASADEVRSHLRPLSAAVAHLIPCSVSDEQVRSIRQGQAVRIEHCGDAGACAVFDGRGNLVGTGSIDNGVLRPEKNLTIE